MTGSHWQRVERGGAVPADRSSPPSRVWHQMTNAATWASKPGPIIARAEGCFYWDTDGHRIIDGNSGLQNVHIGHGRQEMANVAQAQIRELDYFPIYNSSHILAETLADALHTRMPEYPRFYFLNSGSEAIEAALKLLREYWVLRGEPRRTIVIARQGSFHGTTLGALSSTGPERSALREPFAPLLLEAVHVSDPLTYAGEDDAAATDRLSAELQMVIEESGSDRILGVVAEPVQLYGVPVPPSGYWQELRRVCDHFDIPLVADEIITGFGRVGRLFGLDQWKVVPDIAVLGKGMASGYAPISGVAVGPTVCRVFDEAPDHIFHHISTTAGHPLCCALALENLRIIEDEDLASAAERSGGVLRVLLQEAFAAKPYVSGIRGIGLLNSVLFDPSVVASGGVANAALRSACLELGAHVRVDGQMWFIPPLIIDRTTLEELVAIAAAAADAWAEEFAR